MAIQDDNNDHDNESTSSGETTEDAPMTAKQFNQAISAREKAFEKKIARMQEEHNAVIAKLVPKQAEEAQLSERAELKRTVSELQRRVTESDQKEKNNFLRQSASQALKDVGVDGDFVDHALAYLVDAKKSIKFDSDGQPVFVIGGIEYSLDEGAQMWAASKDAKLYKKASNAQGSGSSNFRSPAQSGSNGSSIELKRDPNKIKNFDGSKSTLNKQSREQLSSLLSKKLFSQ